MQEKCCKLEELVKKYKKFNTETQKAIKYFSVSSNEEIAKLLQENTNLKQSLSLKSNTIQELENLLIKIIFTCNKIYCENVENKTIMEKIKNLETKIENLQNLQNNNIIWKVTKNEENGNN